MFKMETVRLSQREFSTFKWKADPEGFVNIMCTGVKTCASLLMTAHKSSLSSFLKKEVLSFNTQWLTFTSSLVKSEHAFFMAVREPLQLSKCF